MPEVERQLAVVRLKAILERAKKLKISSRGLGKLHSVKKLVGSHSSSNHLTFTQSRFNICVLVVVTAICVRCFFAYNNQTELLTAWFSLQRSRADAEKCVTYVPDSLSSLFRPPEDCSICLNVSEVDKVSNISPVEFEERYVQTGHPIVVTDAMTNWTAQSFFDFQFFKQIYEESSSNWTFPSACQFFPYKTEFKELREVFNMDETRANLAKGTEPWYVGWSNCDEKVSRVLRQHYEPPYFLPQTSENKQTDWIFMGSPGYGAKMHIDNVNFPSWQAQLHGKKTWTLQPPLECLFKCETLSVDVLPGEIIALDTNRWYHQTLISSNDLSITIGAEFD